MTATDLTATPKQCFQALHRAAHASKPLFVWGPPGIGKSDVVAQFTDSLSNSIMIDIRLALMEPTDLRGYPYRDPEANCMKWSAPDELPSYEMAKMYDHIVLFLDELPNAPGSVQSAAYQLVLNRRVGQYRLPDNVIIVAAGNRENDRGNTYRMPSPLANRFRHYHMVPDFDDWFEWALKNREHSDVISYLSATKQDLFNFDPGKSGVSFATPRSWSGVSRALHHPGFNDLTHYEQMLDIAGEVGQGIASKFMGHRRLGERVPTAEQIASGKVTELDKSLEKEVSAKYKVVSDVCFHLYDVFKKNNDVVDDKLRSSLSNCLRFAHNNISSELNILLYRTLLANYKVHFNPRTDLDRDVYDVFGARYAKLVVNTSKVAQ